MQRVRLGRRIDVATRGVPHTRHPQIHVGAARSKLRRTSIRSRSFARISALAAGAAKELHVPPPCFAWVGW
jgi:hypothetical protein